MERGRTSTKPILPQAVWSQAGWSQAGWLQNSRTSSAFWLGPQGNGRNRASRMANHPSNRTRNQARSGPTAVRGETRIGLALSPDSDSGILGDGKTSFTTVDLLGLTTPNRRVSLNMSTSGMGATGISLTATADASGSFLFSNLPLGPGATQFTASLGAGSSPTQFTLTVQRQPSDLENPVLSWNAVALRSLRRDRAGSLEASRTLAILHAALFDAVNALSAAPGPGYRPVSNPPPDGSAAAAAAGAAHRVLSQLYPDQSAALDAALVNSLSQIPTNQEAEQTGAAFGARVADALLSERSQDGSNRQRSFRPRLQPGFWRPTPPRFLPAAAPQWAEVKPFLLQAGSQFRPAAPPRLASSAYAHDLNQVKRLGQLESRDRTPQQTETARFWLGNAGSLTFPGLWNMAAANLLADAAGSSAPNTLLSQARLFAQLNFALADAGIAAWDAKYAYQTWRPITAIRLANRDGNPATQADPTWQSLLETPAHPDYVSAHSTYAGAASAVLDQAFGQVRPRFTSLDFPGPQRSFASFARAADQAGLSRIYGGIHSRSANRRGIQLGQQIGRYVLRQL